MQKKEISVLITEYIKKIGNDIQVTDPLKEKIYYYCDRYKVPSQNKEKSLDKRFEPIVSSIIENEKFKNMSEKEKLNVLLSLELLKDENILIENNEMILGENDLIYYINLLSNSTVRITKGSIIYLTIEWIRFFRNLEKENYNIQTILNDAIDSSLKDKNKSMDASKIMIYKLQENKKMVN